MKTLSFSRWWGIVLKEFLQLRRDRITFGMIVGIPIIQLVLFGYAINSDPRHLPTAVIAADQSEFTRSYLAAMKNSGYFRFVGEQYDEASARAARVVANTRSARQSDRDRAWREGALSLIRLALRVVGRGLPKD